MAYGRGVTTAMATAAYTTLCKCGSDEEACSKEKGCDETFAVHIISFLFYFDWFKWVFRFCFRLQRYYK